MYNQPMMQVSSGETKTPDFKGQDLVVYNRLLELGYEGFSSRSNKLWRLENLYYIITKQGKKELFKLNRAQRHFHENYLEKGFRKFIILKSRQLGFSTFISIWILDEILFTENKDALTIAHTQKDATELFNKKVKYAISNMPGIIQNSLNLDQSRAAKIQVRFQNQSTSSMLVTASGRSNTPHYCHISELGPLCRMYPQRVEEIVSGTLSVIPEGGYLFIESTAEGVGNYLHEKFMSSWNKRDRMTPALADVDFMPVFYNWTWDDMEMDMIKDTISIEDMEEGEINWRELKAEHNLTDVQLTYYYKKYSSVNYDIDKLHSQFPFTAAEAFISSGSHYFNIERVSSEYEKQVPYAEYNTDLIEIDKGELRVYEEPIEGKKYVIGGDVAQGRAGGDYSTAVVVGLDKQIKAIYQGHIDPDDYEEFIRNLGKKYNNALLAVEFNQDGNWVNTELMKNGYTNIYFREEVDDVTKTISKRFGWLTNKKSRDFALGEIKAWHLKNSLKDRRLMDEMTTFVRNKRGKPEAQIGKHDDIILAASIALAVVYGKQEHIVNSNDLKWFQHVFID